MSAPHTLRGLMGLPVEPAPLGRSALIMIDLQNTYTDGVMRLENVEPALEEAAVLLDRARSAGARVIHVQHDAGEGSPYDVTAPIGAIHDSVAPRDGEAVVVKNFPSAFVHTGLAELLEGYQDLVLAGFMTHMCINSTARSAFSAGHVPTVVAAATATRDLPGVDGTVRATEVHAAALAGLADLPAIVVPGQKSVPD
ncbi:MULTISPECIES: cysteine hydrolase family protein [Pseudonocardia]|uniref:Streptothricin hydrolase n=2 Tax=Pseudonocardia TaxID=1847 RepID=A0A1Y2MXI5_PSEAH|nr:MULTISPECIES: cysteine hydrolase family protein [Pseudonocardia]OSY39791.1 Streptothricin hydrolase [Pseudonocardia autotrophica]TDN74387.1 nicotinamidase-related amidase [Pseudonocardia autotrophica]BBG05154.1 isochorismatase [Pseudonocardia autotrophica]GEC28127.1 isochorismatase [Pseudonocardia saturnea]